jgi:hypothetical protein
MDSLRDLIERAARLMGEPAHRLALSYRLGRDGWAWECVAVGYLTGVGDSPQEAAEDLLRLWRRHVGAGA